MGGKKKGGVVGGVKGLVNDAVKVSTAGTVDIEKKKINLNGTDNFKAFSEGATGTSTMSGILGQPDAPIDPLSPDNQEDIAEKEAKRKLSEELGAKSRGFAATQLGGSLGDSSNIKKKKLLGE